jgi:hypothetical protein
MRRPHSIAEKTSNPYRELMCELVQNHFLLMINMLSIADNHANQYDARLTVLCPAGLPQAINAAAAARLQRPAEYIRAAILARLQADGVAIGTPEAEAKASV